MKESHNTEPGALQPGPSRPDLSPEGTTTIILMCILPTFKLKFHCCYPEVVALREKRLGKSEEKVGFGNLQNILGRTLQNATGLCVVSSAGHLAPSTLVNTLTDSGSSLSARQPGTRNLTNH